MEIINKDILGWAKDYTGPNFHAVLCDPPYELGFMGKSWDSTGIAFNSETWRAISKHLYPGAYLLAFGGTRTFHRIAVAIEDAGFEIRDTVMYVYGSGFPKSLDVSKAIDKVSGEKRERIRIRKSNAGSNGLTRDDMGYDDSGSAARFFYSAKVSKRERDAGLEGFEEKQSRGGGGQGVGNPELEKVAHAYGSIKAPAHNFHPTLKPISLTTYLAKLIIPPKLDQPRRLLVPFSGSGSEVIGALKAGWDEVVGVEQDKEYCEIAKARITHWTKQEKLL